MTEKRFKLSKPHGAYLVDIEDDENYIVGHWDNDDDKIIDLLNSLNEENEQLKAQLYCDSNEGVCIICKHHYLEKENIFYISKCEKGHEKCSKESVKHCEDFKLNELKE